MFENYQEQVALLVKVLPLVAEEKCFALHGGTAINLFVRNMPRLSVDIDLTYLPIEDRPSTLKNISEALIRVKNRIEQPASAVRVQYKEEVGKLLIKQEKTDIKLEVNLVARGTITEPVAMTLCDKAYKEFEAFVEMPIVPFGQLYGGKICAALDRQHPRDLFDVKLLMENEGFVDDIHIGFLLCLLCSDRPINEVLVPNFQDQHQAMDNQFTGMTDVAFTYDDFERTREQLVETVNKSLTAKDKEFLLSVKNCEPDWSIHDFERFPAVQWKLQNLRKLKESNPDKHTQLYQALKEKLHG